MKKYIFLVFLLILALAWGPLMSKVEQAKYIVVQHHDSIEIRDYPSMIVAEVEVAGDRASAINQGFRLIANYIFGNNFSAEKVAMTAPVLQQEANHLHWKVHFVMPDSYTLATLPKPKNNAIKLKEISPKRFAVIRFSGIAKTKRIEQEQKKLEAFILQQNLTPTASAIYAFFNPPWTLPYFRRNEIMIEIKK